MEKTRRFVRAALTCSIACLVAVGSQAAPVKKATPHPLLPLSSQEMLLVSKLVTAHQDFPKGALFPMVMLQEPSKEELAAFATAKKGAVIPRRAQAIVLDRAANRSYEAVVDLAAKKVESFRHIPGVQPFVLVEEYETVPKIVKADPRWQAAMRKRGIEDFNRLQVDTWAASKVLPESVAKSKELAGARLLRAITYVKDCDMNFYGRPVEGVIAIVNMNTSKVVDLIDTGVVPVAGRSEQFDEASWKPLRKDIKPLRISQPEGPSFAVDGNEVRWQKWRFRYSLHPREGLVLHTVTYNDGGRERSILHRGSLAEMAVPYGDADVNWSWRSAFDSGEYGVGRLAAPLEKNQDGPSNTTYFDAVFSDDFGKPYTAKNVVGLYERDGGMIWKHFDIYSQKNETRRARQLVLFFVAAIGNYDYSMSWIFHQDGTLQMSNELTGIMLPKGVRFESADQMGHAAHAGHLVAPNVAAPHHQHFFNFRLDFDVDGVKNSVLESNTSAVKEGRDNPQGNAMTMELVPLRTEKEAGREVSIETARKWVVVNPSLKTALGYPPGYAILPEDNSIPYVQPSSSVRRRAGFLDHHFWATRYQPEELYAAGKYPNQGGEGEGLPRFVSDNESLVNEDVVTWYTVGITHIPRPEEWPVMPATHLGFKLIPVGFFERNPAMDLPRLK